MKLFVLVDQMQFGGAARVASIMLEGFAASGHEIMLETDLSFPPSYHIPENVRVMAMEKSKGALHRIMHHRQLIRSFKPDCIIAYLPPMYLDVWLATRCMRHIPIIASDHTSMNRDLGWRNNFIRRHLYGLASITTILTEKDRRILGERVKCKEVVYNPLTFEPVSTVDIYRDKTILCAGRLNSWDVKGFDRIIKIWGELSNLYPDWTLEIAGPGSDESVEKIKEFIENAGVEQTTKLLGNIIDMQPLYQRSAVFALPSRVEGFPMVLLEAMSQGCACISFDFDGAITEITGHEKGCLIIADNNLEEFKDGLSALLDDENLRLKISSLAIESVKQYSVDRFIKHWNQILNRTIKK